VAGHAQLVPGATTSAAVHALRAVFVVTGIFALGGLATIVFGVDRSARAVVPTTVLVPEDGGDERPLAETALSA
jgi:hypothetical protein